MEEGETGEKEGGEEIEHPVGAGGSAGEDLEGGIGGEAEAEAGGDGIREWNRHEGEEGGDGDAGLVPVDFGGGG